MWHLYASLAEYLSVILRKLQNTSSLGNSPELCHMSFILPCSSESHGDSMLWLELYSHRALVKLTCLSKNKL